MIDPQAVADAANHIRELHELRAAGLVVSRGGDLQFPQPDHPRVVAWRALPPPQGEMIPRGWLLYEIGQVYAEARDRKMPGEVIALWAEEALRIPHMPLSEVHAKLTKCLRNGAHVH